MQTSFDIRTIKAIIGLGNPGAVYYKNRHSIGFRILDSLAQKFGISWRTTNDMDVASYTNADGGTIYLIKPLTFMNNSGRVVPWLLKKGIKPEEILVVHDELEKDFGKTMIRFGGSARGHNGLKSLIGVMSDGFWRLRFGISRPENKEDVSAYVLTNFSKDEETQVNSLIEEVLKIFQ